MFGCQWLRHKSGNNRIAIAIPYVYQTPPPPKPRSFAGKEAETKNQARKRLSAEDRNWYIAVVIGGIAAMYLGVTGDFSTHESHYERCAHFAASVDEASNRGDYMHANEILNSGQGSGCY